jgi:hypothetical protein
MAPWGRGVEANADTAENIQNRIDVLTGSKSNAVSSAKKMPPLLDALHMGPDMAAQLTLERLQNRDLYLGTVL